MPFARLVEKNGDVVRTVIEQMDFVPSPGQIIVEPESGIRYVVLDETPEVHYIKPGGGMAGKWMNIVKVEFEDHEQACKATSRRTLSI